MRVIAGYAKGMKLISKSGNKTRPTTDRLKETLFNIIANEIFERSFLDIFSGSGAIGIEALSRGASEATFIENCKECVSIINKNLTATNLAEKSNVFCGDFALMLKLLYKKGKKFDVIFLDPPYYKGLAYETLCLIDKFQLLSEDGIIITEQGSLEKLPKINGLLIYREKVLKTTTFVFLKKES